MKIQEFDVVRITAQLPEDRVDPAFGEPRRHASETLAQSSVLTPCRRGRSPVFMVECVSPEGVVRWLADVYQSELELVSSAHRTMPDDRKPAPPRGST